MLRFSLYRLVVLVCVATIVYTTIRWCQILFGRADTDSRHFQHTCNMTEQYRQELEHLFERVHRLLVQHGLTHFLCYGTLWGQIRMAKMLPWREKAEFCVLNDELMRHEEARFIRNFYSSELQIHYLHSEGIYRIFANEPTVRHATPYVELVVFQLDETGTLPKRPLGRHHYTVPMGGIELQKYHYPDNWWKDVKIPAPDMAGSSGPPRGINPAGTLPPFSLPAAVTEPPAAAAPSRS
uniref:Uncharacterized protein n=1 Tax=Anopheles maculatus TaxID=74869 RepID=A0A182SWE4_9DIPT